MSTNEVCAEEGAAAAAHAERKSGSRLRFVLLASFVFALALGAGVFFIVKHRAAATRGAGGETAAPATDEAATGATAGREKSWKIAGDLTEACTCAVPCTCNFGEGPSPHSYCYPFYSYHIRKGNYGDVALDDLHFGAADLRGGRHMFMDERATPEQRKALLIVMARVVERVSADEAEKKAEEMAEEMRYTSVEQQYDERKNLLKVAGVGEFAADYIMGLDKSSPVVVRNNTTWRVRDAIKAKTSIYKVKIGRDAVDTKETNSNQGEFEYTSEMNFGGPVRWNCGACANRTAHNDGEPACHK